MTDERASQTRRRPATSDDEPLDPQQAEALSRAAREAVRQPADPRIEKSFAHLGLVPEPDEPARQGRSGARPRPRRGSAGATAGAASAPPPTATVDTGPSAEPAPAPPGDVVAPVPQPLIEALAAWQRSTDDLRRRLDVLTWLLAGVVILIGVLALVLILRGPG